MRAFIRDQLQDLTFKEIYDKNGWILNICVTDAYFQKPGLQNGGATMLNYLNAPDVLVWSACLCSGSIPDMFDPSELFIKNKHGNIERYYP